MIALLVLSVIIVVVDWGIVVASKHAVLTFQQPQYWLDYRSGFVRRGLPGSVLAAVLPGTLTVRQMHVAGCLLSLFAVSMVLVLIRRTVDIVAGRVERLAAVAMLATSPLTIGPLVRDVGRYDTIGVVALVVLASTRPSVEETGRALGVYGAAVAVFVTTASEEFLLAFLVPVVLIAFRRPLVRVIILTPAAGVVAASMLVQPSPALVERTLTRARAAGAYTEANNAVDVLRKSLREEAHAVLSFDRRALVVTAVALAALFLLSAGALKGLVPVPGRAFWLLVVYFVAVAATLSVLGIDYRRWWTLAFLGLWSATVQWHRRAAGTRREPRPRSSNLSLAVGLATFGIAGQEIPVYPLWSGYQRTVVAVGVVAAVVVALLVERRQDVGSTPTSALRPTPGG